MEFNSANAKSVDKPSDTSKKSNKPVVDNSVLFLNKKDERPGTSPGLPEYKIGVDGN